MHGRIVLWKNCVWKNCLWKNCAWKNCGTPQLLSPLFLWLREGSGEFCVRTQVFRPENIAVYCSSSGKISKDLVKSWFLDSFLPSIDKKALLLLDSWTGQSDRKMFEDLLTGDKLINILKIHPKEHHLFNLLMFISPVSGKLWQESFSSAYYWMTSTWISNSATIP